MKTIEDLINEGMFDAFKSMKQFTKLQGVVVDEYEALIDKNPKHFHDGKQVLDAVYQFAMKKYDEIITVNDAMSFKQWWSDFSEAHSRLLDKTVFNKVNK